jgi:3-keto-disaccharide hydrolase
MHIATHRPVSLAFAAALLLTLAGPASATSVEAQAAPPAPAHHQAVTFHEPAPLDFSDHTGFQQIFDGKSLADWEGDPTVWRVEDGAIVGESSKEHPVFNAYIWRKNLVVRNFDLKLEIKCEIGGGSGIQYRSQTGLPWIRPMHPGEKPRNLNWMMTGPQADIWYPVNPQHAQYTGQIYSENSPLGIEAWRGEVVERKPGAPPQLIGTLGNREALGGYVKINDWNQYEIIARGGVLMQILNGHMMAVLIDDDPKSSNNQPGKIGIELESTPAKVSVRDIWIRELP